MVIKDRNIHECLEIYSEPPVFAHLRIPDFLLQNRRIAKVGVDCILFLHKCIIICWINTFSSTKYNYLYRYLFVSKHCWKHMLYIVAACTWLLMSCIYIVIIVELHTVKPCFFHILLFAVLSSQPYLYRKQGLSVLVSFWCHINKTWEGITPWITNEMFKWWY